MLTKGLAAQNIKFDDFKLLRPFFFKSKGGQILLLLYCTVNILFLRDPKYDESNDDYDYYDDYDDYDYYDDYDG